MSPEQNKQFVRRYLEAISGQAKTPALVNQFVANEHLTTHIMDFEAAFPRYELVAEDLIAEGDKVLIRAIARGKHEGMFQKMAPTHKAMEIPLMVLYRIADNKIVDFWMQADMLKLMQQLGMMPQAA
ncbi:MAG: ester cyclase [Anaerolineae bacterium]|nr:ester cyclase [Anaerolineae bacterium]